MVIVIIIAVTIVLWYMFLAFTLIQLGILHVHPKLHLALHIDCVFIEFWLCSGGDEAKNNFQTTIKLLFLYKHFNEAMNNKQ